MNFKFKLGFIGFGNMATAILSGVLQSGILSNDEIAIYDRNEIAVENAKKRNVFIANSNADLVKSCEFVFFAVKPQAFDDVAKEIGESFSSDNKIISIIAGTKISKFQKYFKNVAIARAMPNTPALIKCGMTGVDASMLAKCDADFVLKLFNCVGDVIEIAEEQINDVIAISGSGPAYAYLFIKGMVEKALKLGFDDKTAKKLVLQTVIGSAKMFENSTENIDVLIDRVCSRGGTTIEAVKVFQNDGLIELIDKAIQACYDRAVKLSEDKE
ncbi:MAG: pyrroline-5-carboxylate reductase [Clostridia bacterium]